MSTVLIAGASRGIGWEFVSHFKAKGWSVDATARDGAGLDRLARAGATPHRLDVTSDDSIAALACELSGAPSMRYSPMPASPATSRFRRRERNPRPTSSGRND